MLLEVSDLTVRYDDWRTAVRNVDFALGEGTILAVVGESGSGKTTLLHAVAGLLPENGSIVGGSIQYGGEDLARFDRRRWRRLHGDGIGYIFQDAGSSLNPSVRIEAQFVESIRSHRPVDRRSAGNMARLALQKLRFDDVERVMRSFPHQLSGGMRQRVSVAMAMALGPRLILADEPTSAVDTSNQVRILGELRRLRDEFGTAVLLVTHGIGAAASIADEIAVMREGCLVERAAAAELVSRPKTAYAKELLRAVVSLDDGCEGAAAPRDSVVYSVESVSKLYAAKGGRDVAALDSVSFIVNRGESLGIVGESGCGKSTLARMLMGIERPDRGRIVFEGEDVAAMSRVERTRYYRKAQLVFQDSATTFSPRMRVERALREPLSGSEGLGGKGWREAIDGALREMGLPSECREKYPHELSGGELQRVSIARCLEAEPEVVIYDEPTSALDSVIQRRIIDDVLSAHMRRGLTSIFISHDLALLNRICDRILVMRRGSLVEEVRGGGLAGRAMQPYTLELIADSRALSLDKRAD